jgi:hypothetical protein
MSTLSVIYILDKLLLEQDFSKKLEASIENIMKDGKIDQYDIPEIIYIISELITKTPNLNLTPENLSEVVKKLVDLICKKYKLIPDDTQQESFDRLIKASVKLLLLNTNITEIKEKTTKCWSILCCKNKKSE